MIIDVNFHLILQTVGLELRKASRRKTAKEDWQAILERGKSGGGGGGGGRAEMAALVEEAEVRVVEVAAWVNK